MEEEQMTGSRSGLWSEGPIARLPKKHFATAEKAPPQFYVDALGTQLEVGDIIAYPIKRGSSACTLRIARVTRAEPDKGHLQAEIKVRNWSKGWPDKPKADQYKLKKVPLRNPDRVVVVMNKTYAKASKFELPVGS